LVFCAFIARPAAALAAAAVGRVVLRALGDPVDPALLAEARRLDLDYVTVSAAPHLYVGKPVLWCLTRQDSHLKPETIVGGNISQGVRIGGGDMLPVNTGWRGRCKTTLAVVQETEELGLVSLRFVGHP
jgi:hypothetical protein